MKKKNILWVGASASCKLLQSGARGGREKSPSKPQIRYATMITHQLLNAMIFNSLYFAVIEVKTDSREEILFFIFLATCYKEMKGEKFGGKSAALHQKILRLKKQPNVSLSKNSMTTSLIGNDFPFQCPK